jgi:hypothetical protein
LPLSSCLSTIFLKGAILADKKISRKNKGLHPTAEASSSGPASEGWKAAAPLYCFFAQADALQGSG